MELKIRAAINDDRPFIMSSWLRCYRKSPDSNLNDLAFFAAYRPIVEYLIITRTVEVITPADDTNLILGYIVYEPGVVHWVYIKKDFRGNGLARELIKQVGDNPVLTFTTPLGRKRLRYRFKPRVLSRALNKEFNSRGN